MRQMPVKRRTKGTERDTTKIKDKFLEQREQQVKSKPLVAMNDRQKDYMRLLATKPVVVATGYAGTSKTYLPVCMAADLYMTGKITKIYVTRPAISSSQSLGFFKGSEVEKLSIWLTPVTSLLKERMGTSAYDIALAKGDICLTPLEVIKGFSINNAWLIVEESSDLTKDEVVKLITRMGTNSKIILSGDVRQRELKGQSGLVWLSGFIKRNDLSDNFGFVDFDLPSHIVRSESVRQFIVALVEEENK